MREQPDFTEEFENAQEKYGRRSSTDGLDRIERRACASDNHDGVEYTFYGNWVHIRPIIDVVAGKEDFGIENMTFIDESTDNNDIEPKVSVFVADLRPRNQPHPAFIGNPYQP